MRTSILTSATELAAGQWGLFTTAQAQAAGISRMQLARMVDAGVLERVAYGVYAAPAVMGEELLPLRAAWLALAPAQSAEERLADAVASGVVSHASAARLHGLGDLLADVHEFTLPRRYQSTREGVRVHRGVLTTGEVTIAGGLPVTVPARTVADLLTAGHDFEHVGQVAVDAVRTGVATGHELAVALGTVRHGGASSDSAELASELLTVGGLGSRELTTRLVRGDASLALVRRALDEQLGLSPQHAKLVEDFAALVGAAVTSPELRAALERLTDRTRAVLTPVNEQIARVLAPTVTAARAGIAAVMPSTETRQRITAWLEDPDNQVALEKMLAMIRAYSEIASALDDATPRSTTRVGRDEHGPLPRRHSAVAGRR